MRLSSSAIKRNLIFWSILIALSFVCFYVLSTINDSKISNYESKIQSVTDDISNMEMEISVADKPYALSDNTEFYDTVSEVTGANQVRINTDTEIAEDFFSMVLTFDDGVSYEENREQLISYFGEDAQIVKDYFPKMRKVGNYNSIDTNDYNCSYDSITSYLLDITEDDTYQYFAVVYWTTLWKGAEGDGESVFRYDVDKDGNLLNLRAYNNVNN